jgi:hypothetical protein
MQKLEKLVSMPRAFYDPRAIGPSTGLSAGNGCLVRVADSGRIVGYEHNIRQYPRTDS